MARHVCEKADECLDDGVKMGACVTDCEKNAAPMQESYLSAVDTCSESSCRKFDDCLESADGECTMPDNINEIVAAFCAKFAECDEDIDEGDCRDELEYDDFRDGYVCVSEDAVSGVAGCIEEAGCRTFEDDYDACLRDAGL